MVYNVKSYKYDDFEYITTYSKSIIAEEKPKDSKSTFTKSYKNEDRTQEEAQRCFENSINQTRKRVFNLVKSNKWEYFITLTFKREDIKWSADNYNDVARCCTQFMANLKRRYAPDLIYIIVPEFHSDGKNFHFHGLVANVGSIKFVESGHFTDAGDIIFNMIQWKYGFSTATVVKDSDKCSSYISKYMNKNNLNSIPNKKRYFCSRNILKVQPTFYNMELSDLIEEVADDIEASKTQYVKKAGQRINYLRLKIDT